VQIKPISSLTGEKLQTVVTFELDAITLGQDLLAAKQSHSFVQHVTSSSNQSPKPSELLVMVDTRTPTTAVGPLYVLLDQPIKFLAASTMSSEYCWFVAAATTTLFASKYSNCRPPVTSF